MYNIIFYINMILFLILLILKDMIVKGNNELSPYNQHLPDCKKGYEKLKKKTNKKGILCPMIKDEEGFLAEWIAYYQVHGFDHIMLFDDESSDNYKKEIEPWLKSGFVSIISNWTLDSLEVSWLHRRNDFKRAMATKALLERECKLKAIEWGYDYHISLDLDEYVVPNKAGETIIDALDTWMNSTGRFVYCMEKYNFPSTPHILEPINLLQIEAYQSRMKGPSKMNYYTSVAPKCGYTLRHESYSNITTSYLVSCCHFHGCQGHDFIDRAITCKTYDKQISWILKGKGKPWYNALSIFHYSRSLEKYALKMKSWKTATGEIMGNQTIEDAAKGYDIPGFLHRSVGWLHDATALRYTCQMRELLQQMTNEPFFLRHGTFWYRNPEFGKIITEPKKRGRYGRPNPDNFKYNEPNPFHYHGQSLNLS